MIVRVCRQCGCSTMAYQKQAVTLCNGCGLTHNGKKVHLSPSEIRALFRILLQQGGPASNEDVWDWVWWGDPTGGGVDWDSVIKVRIFHIRRKLREAGVPILIETDWGRGYRIEMDK